VSFTLSGGGNPDWTINIFNPVTGLLLQPALQSYSRFEVGRSARVVTTPGNAVAVTFNGLGRIVSPSPIATPNLQQIDITSVIAAKPRPCASSPTTCMACASAIPIPRCGS
jgi:hypothetical protein